MSARNLVINAGVSMLAQAGTILLTLVTLPYILHKLGDDAYAIFAMVITVSGYLAILQMGLGRSIVRFVAGDHARGDLPAIHRHIGTALAVYLVLGAVGAAIMGSLAGVLVERLFHVPLPLRAPGRAAFLIAAAGLLVQFPLNVLSTIPAAVQMLRVTSLLRSGVRCASLLAVVVLLGLGKGLVELAWAQVIVNGIAVVCSAHILRRLLPGLGLRTMRIDLPFVRPLLRESLLVSWGGAMAVLTMHLDRFLLGVFLPIGSIAPYFICQDLAAKIWLVPTHVLEAVYPEMSARHAVKRPEAVRDLYGRAGRAIVLAVVPVALALALCARQILAAWIGVEMAAAAATTLRLLAVAALTSSIGWPAVTAAQSTGRPEIPARVQTLQALVNTAACLVLIPRYGIDGAALAWLINHLVGIPILVAIVSRRLLAIPLREWLSRSLLRPILVSSLPMVAILPLRDHLTNMPALVVGLALTYAVSLALSYHLVLDAIDRRIVTALVRDAISRISRASRASRISRASRVSPTARTARTARTAGAPDTSGERPETDESIDRAA